MPSTTPSKSSVKKIKPNTRFSLLTSGLIWIWISVVVIALDRFSKYWVMHHLDLFEPRELTSFLNLTLAYNKGASFGFLNQATGWQNIFFGSIAVIASLIIIIWLVRTSAKAYWHNIALCLILGGALGNAWDRADFGFVIDFISVHWQNWYFAVFNVADGAISVGAVMLLIHWLRDGFVNR